MNAVINKANEATLEYLAESKEWNSSEWRSATKAEFLKFYNFDDICGIDGNALSENDEILCTDGVIMGSDLL